MLNNLKNIIAKFMRKSVVDENAVKALIKELQKVLISSDVDIKLVLKLSQRIKRKLLEEEKPEGITLREHAVKTIYDEITAICGSSYDPRLDKHTIMLVGLYGSGKTTTAGKLALFYKNKGLKPLLIAADTDRPAAKEQLRQIAEEIKVGFCTSNDKSEEIVRKCLKNRESYDVIIIDTAGRNALNAELAEELKALYDIAKPEEVFLVLSADTGKTAKVQAKAFAEILPLTAVIITKMDGSGKAGGALTAVAETGLKIAFIGTGEKLNALQTYDARSFVGKMLGFTDINALIEKFKQKELPKTTELNFNTFLEQLKESKELLPEMMSQLNVGKQQMWQSEELMKKYEAIILSMTPEERSNPELLKGNSSRIERISKGSGTKPEEVRKFVNLFFKMKKMYKQLSHDRGMINKIKKFLKGGSFKFPF